MIAETDHIEARKDRHRAVSAVKHTRDALTLARHLLDRGDIVSAARATQLAERQARLAERLIALDASLKCIAEAKRAAEQHFAQRTAELIKREAAVAVRERANTPKEDYSWMDVRNPRFQAWCDELWAAKEEREEREERKGKS